MKPEDKINIDPVEDLKPIEDMEPLTPVKSPLREVEELPNAITRIDHYLKAIAGQQEGEEMPNAITRIDHYLKAIAENGGAGLNNITIFEADSNFNLLNDKSIPDVISAINSGSVVYIKANQRLFSLCSNVGGQQNNTLYFGNISRSYNNGDLWLIGAPLASTQSYFTSAGHFYIARPATYANKILKSDSNFNWIESDLELPAVTSDDNGKILKVVDGVWTAANP